MNTLIIKAHPGEWGFTHKIADTYKQTREENGDSVEVIDLYENQNQQSYLSFDEEMNPTTADVAADVAVQKVMQNHIAKADHIVFIHPIWWSGMPAVMKNWIDWTLDAGFAFNFKENGKVEKLLTGKTARVFATADGPKVMYLVIRPLMSMMFGQGVLGFCGIKQQSYDLFPEMHKHKNDADRNAMLEKVRKRAQN